MRIVNLALDFTESDEITVSLPSEVMHRLNGPLLRHREFDLYFLSYVCAGHEDNPWQDYLVCRLLQHRKESFPMPLAGPGWQFLSKGAFEGHAVHLFVHPLRSE